MVEPELELEIKFRLHNPTYCRVQYKRRLLRPGVLYD